MAELGPPRMASTVRRFSVPVTRRRYATAATRNAEGLRAYPTPTATTIQAHVFPANTETVKLPEGGEASARVEVHTADDVRIADEQAGLLADEVVWQGLIYEIVTVNLWQGGAAASSEIWRAAEAVAVFGRPAAA